MAAFHADERGDFPFAMNPLDVGGGKRQLERLRVMGDELVDVINLLQNGLDRGGAAESGRDVHRPELAAEPASAQPRQVGNQVQFACVRMKIDGAEVIAALSVLPGQIVVAVNDRNLAEDLADLAEPRSVRERLGRESKRGKAEQQYEKGVSESEFRAVHPSA